MDGVAAGVLVGGDLDGGAGDGQQGLAGGGVVGGGLWLAVMVGARLSGAEVPTDPIGAVGGVLTGTIPWPGLGATATLGCELLIVVSLARMGWRIYWARRRRRTRVDDAARLMGRGRELAEYSEAGVAESAARLRPNGTGGNAAEHGIRLGTTIAAPVQRLRAPWESTITVIAGPRRYKTLAYVIPQVIEAPGPVLATTLRRDVWDATVDLRREKGRVWNFDPQRLISSDEPSFWVDLLAEVRSIDDARKLKDHFVMGTRGPNATTSAYFDSEGESLLARMILAAAIKRGGTLLDVYDWLTDPTAIEPVVLLREADQPLAAKGLDKIRKLSAEKQKEGVYGSASALVSCLENPEVNRWITPPHDKRIPQFDPAAFVRSKDTLYMHSREGEGNISPLIAALTQSVFDAGLRQASRSRGGRLDPPLVGSLDEVANVCKIKNLPALVSYVGGAGINLMNIFQSIVQGKDVWGENGMRALLGASTARVYGGGLEDPESLRRFADVIGPWREPVTTLSYDSQGRRSTSRQPQKTPIMEVSDLFALPKGRAVVFLAGARPALVAPEPWTQTEYAPRIRASIAANGPAIEDNTASDSNTAGDSKRPTTGDTLTYTSPDLSKGPWL